MWQPKTLKARLAALVAIAALPIAVTMALMAMHMRAAALSDAKEGLSRIAKNFVQGQDQITAAAHQALSILSRIPAVTEGDPKACSDALALIVKGEALFYNFGRVDLDGNIQCNARQGGAAENVSDRSYFQRALRSRDFATGDYQMGRVTKQPSMAFALPILGNDGETRAVLYAVLQLSKLFTPTANAPDQVITLMDPGFNVLVRSPPDAMVGKTLIGTEMHRAFAQGDGATSVESFGGLGSVRRINALARIGKVGEVGGYVAVSTPESIVIALANQILISGLLALLLAIGAMAAIMFIGGNTLVLKRVGALLAATRRIAAGDLTTRIPVSSDGSEFSVLENAFNDMAHSNELNFGKINQLNRVYAVLTEINGAILRIREAGALAAEACNISVKTGGYLTAAIIMYDKDTSKSRLAGHAGAGRGYFEALQPEMIKVLEPDNTPLVRALRSGKPVIEQEIDLLSSPRRRETFLKYNVQAVAAFPLTVEGQVTGALVLWSSVPGSFDDEEVRLLQQLAEDTGLGLEHIAQQANVYQLSNFDRLTGLPNRLLFEDRAAQLFSRASHVQRVAAVLVIRVGRFLQINDRYGWAGVSQVLTRVGGYLSEAVRPGDTVARLGDNEFGVLLADVSSVEDAAVTASRIIAGFPRAIAWQEDTIATEGGMGIAICPQDGKDVSTLIHNAEVALNNMTLSPRNASAFYSAELDKRVHERHRMEVELAGAMERNELSLAYQPIVRIADRAIIGAEALLRWHSRTLGQVSPAVFVPLAERAGLITEIGAWVLATASAQRVNWGQRVGDEFRMAVNVSVRQLRAPEFMGRVRQILETTGLEARCHSLCIEITESELMEDIDRATPLLNQLKALGMTLSIDDFGTGYSSLSYLRRLPVDILKIDISFVREIATSADARKLAGSIVALGHSLGLHIVAEGVETEAQLDVLEKMGCDAAQGYLFSRPVPATEFEQLIRSGF